MRSLFTTSWASTIVPLVVLLLAAWAGPATAALEQPLTPQQFSACVEQLAGQTGSAGRPLVRDDFLRIASTAQYDDRVRQALLVVRDEPTFWWDDLAATTDAERVAAGQAVLARAGDTLQRIAQRWGVPREIIVAIYGIETNYGPAGGKIPVLDAALTLACLRPCEDNARACAARERAYSAVRLMRDRKVPADFQGSWAAAFGRTQFVPDSFETLGVDFDGDGLADIIHSEPDAWATTANHLKERGGWIAAAPVYIEVRIPPELQAQYPAKGDSYRQPDRAQPASAWAAQGWSAFGPGGESVPLPALAGDPQLYPFLPVGLPGPAFLVSRNFDTLLRYNRSERYVMEVALLATRLAGGPGFFTPWPTDDPGLTRAQVREVQAWLAAQGHAEVTPDGVVGRKTRDAIEAELRAKGLPPARRVGQRTAPLLMQP